MEKTNLCGKFGTRVELSKFNNKGQCECMGCVDQNCNNCEKMSTSSLGCNECKSVSVVGIRKICLYCENSGACNSNERICFDVSKISVEFFGPRIVKWDGTCSNFILSSSYRNRQR